MDPCGLLLLLTSDGLPQARQTTTVLLSTGQADAHVMAVKHMTEAHMIVGAHSVLQEDEIPRTRTLLG